MRSQSSEELDYKTDTGSYGNPHSHQYVSNTVSKNTHYRIKYIHKQET